MTALPLSTTAAREAEPLQHSDFTDVGSGADHVSRIKKIATLTSGRFRLGTRWIENREVLGVTDSAEMEVTSFERDKTYTITYHKGGRIDTTFSFEPAGTDATNVTVKFELASNGSPPGLLAPLNWAIADKVRDVIGHDARYCVSCFSQPRTKDEHRSVYLGQRPTNSEEEAIFRCLPVRLRVGMDRRLSSLGPWRSIYRLAQSSPRRAI